MKKNYITINSKQTQKLGELLAQDLRGGEIICLIGELGSGKTTFAQGVLRGLRARGPFTSPTFVVMKQYHVTCNTKHVTRNEKKSARNVYHIDAYRVSSKDILDLGWEEIIADKKNILIIEWAERIKNIIPKDAIWFEFEHLKDDVRKIVVKSKFQNPNDKSNPNLKK